MDNAVHILDLPNEVLQRIFVLSQNYYLLDASKSLKIRLDDPLLRPQIIELFFNPSIHSGQILECSYDSMSLQALLKQPWIGPLVAELPSRTVCNWVGRSFRGFVPLLQGPWTQARGDLLTQAIRTSHGFSRGFSAQSVHRGFMDGLQESCIPAVIALGGFEQDVWTEWETTQIVDDMETNWTLDETIGHFRRTMHMTVARHRRHRAAEFTPAHDFRDDYLDSTSTGQSWTRFTHAGFRVCWPDSDVTSTHVLYCMRNVNRNPNLYEFVIRETINRWFRNHPKTAEDLKTFIPAKTDLVEMTAWTLDSANLTDGISPITGIKMQLFYANLLRKRVFKASRADLLWLCADDVQEAINDNWCRPS